jgi:hypothetical protein
MSVNWAVPEWALAAAASRDDWDIEEVRGALLAFQTGATWKAEAAILALARHVTGGEQVRPYDLLNTARNPLDRSIPQPGDPSVRDRELRPLRDLFATRERERQEAAGRREHGDGPR